MTKAQLFIRAFHIQQDKLELCLCYNERISKMFVDHMDDIPEEVKDEFISLTRDFISKYNELLGEEGIDEQEEE